MKREIWKRFINGDEAVLEVLPDKVADSWQNCYENHIDPFLYKPRQLMTVSELKNEQHKNQELIEMVTKEVSVLQHHLEAKLPLFVLTDANGNILWRAGNHQSKDYANDIFFREGSRWSELAVGTNAIGLALKTRQAEQISLDEHYSVSSKNWSCAASPIVDEEGDLLAVLDISTYQNPSAQDAQILLSAVTQKITNRIVANELERKKDLLFYAAAHPDDTILCDRYFRIVHLPVKYAEDLQLNDDIRFYLKKRTIYNQEEIYMNNQMIGYRFVLHTVMKNSDFYYTGIPTTDENYQKFLKKAVRLAQSELPVHLYGESGSGKEVIAETIHYNSSKKNGPMVAINCGALSEELLESQLFGYAPGAFTGANEKGYRGKIEQADGGTLFLDEIDSMSEKMQSSLLRVLEDKYVTPINGPKKAVDFRLVTASNRNLKKCVAEHKFREDLFYRIYVGQLTIPPLRERISDLKPLIIEFCKQKNWLIDWKDKIFATAKNYSWYGNIREFNNFLERLYIFYPDQMPTSAEINDLIEAGSLQINTITKTEHAEKQKIEAALKQEKYHISNTAKNLGISRATLYRKMKEFKIQP